MGFSAESKMGELMDNPEARAILEKHLPAIKTSKRISMARAMTLKMVAGFPQANISPELLQTIEDELAQVED